MTQLFQPGRNPVPHPGIGCEPVNEQERHPGPWSLDHVQRHAFRDGNRRHGNPAASRSRSSTVSNAMDSAGGRRSRSPPRITVATWSTMPRYGSPPPHSNRSTEPSRSSTSNQLSGWPGVNDRSIRTAASVPTNSIDCRSGVSNEHSKLPVNPLSNSSQPEHDASTPLSVPTADALTDTGSFPPAASSNGATQ